MARSFVFVDGERVTPYMAYQLKRLSQRLFELFGVYLVVTSGIRTYEEQKAIFLSRYVTVGNINGRTVYDTRWWDGRWWYRISSAGTVAVPGTSNHEIQGDSAAVDIRDTGNYGGVATSGSNRANWLRANCREFGMEAEGYAFGEAWHYLIRGIDQAVPSGPTRKLTLERQDFLNKYRGEKLALDNDPGPATTAAYRRYQEYLKKNFGYSAGIDGEWGPAMQTAHEKNVEAIRKNAATPSPKPTPHPVKVATVADLAKLKWVNGLQKIAMRNGYRGEMDNIWGSGSAAGLQNYLNANYGGSMVRWLRERWGYNGNDEWGPVMAAAAARAEAENFKAL